MLSSDDNHYWLMATTPPQNNLIIFALWFKWIYHLKLNTGTCTVNPLFIRTTVIVLQRSFITLMGQFQKWQKNCNNLAESVFAKMFWTIPYILKLMAIKGTAVNNLLLLLRSLRSLGPFLSIFCVSRHIDPAILTSACLRAATLGAPTLARHRGGVRHKLLMFLTWMGSFTCSCIDTRYKEPWFTYYYIFF
jgi:hypothetical protein